MDEYHVSNIILNFLDFYNWNNKDITNAEIADIMTTYIFMQNNILEENYETLTAIKFLEDNWDKQGAKEIDLVVVEAVHKLLPFLPYQPDIFPTPDGTVQLEWADKDLNHLNVEIINKTQMTVTEIHNNFISTITYPIDSSILNDKIKELFKGQFEPF